MTPEQTKLARHRLWLGITNVGGWVLTAAGGLLWLVNRGDAAPFPGPGWFVLLALGAVAVQASFDFLGGVVLMPRAGPGPGGFLPRWSRGVLGHTLVMAGVGWVSYLSFRFTSGFGPAILLTTVGLALARRPLLGVVGGVSTVPAAHDGEDMILAVRATDPAFTGGIVGLGPRAASLLPRGWLGELPPAELAAETTRRRWQVERGLPARALLLILGGNLLGAYLGGLVLRLGERPPAVALFGHACWMTLWAFGGLLVLPALSRRAVFAADRAALEAGRDPRGWIAHFPELVGEDGGVNPAVSTIFYPVPTAEVRLRRLGEAVTGFIPGNLARNNLYYSWATFTLLGRAVHCNVGRPALWVFPPSV